MLKIIKRYTDKKRFYHNIRHIGSMIGNMEHYDLNSKDEALLTLAILYHDYVYDPKSNTNEIDSVTEFLTLLANNQIIYDEKALGTKSQVGAYIREMILTTINHIPTVELSKYLIDLDLWDLQSNLVYYRNRKAVFKEYELAGFSKSQIDMGRIEWLRSMLNKDQIFFTDYCVDNNFEKRARKKMSYELENYNLQYNMPIKIKEPL